MSADLYTYARLCNDVYTPGKTAGQGGARPGAVLIARAGGRGWNPK
jgi:hypothetical protein